MRFRYILLVVNFVTILLHSQAQSTTPNVIFILGDDIGYNTLQVNGGKSFSTPNLNAMAEGGMNFTQCNASPLCSPSRCMLLTGKYNFRNYTKWAFLDKGQKTIGNLFHDAGYKTACFGKWQLSGADTSLHTFGFDEYCVWDAEGGNSKHSRYKDPHIYTHSHYVPDDSTAGQYGEDIFADSLMNFIDKNKSAPFFIYYPMVLAHAPFQPVPDDSVFSTWSSASTSDTSYYSSMIKYMDKKIGQVVEKVKSLGIEKNTLIIFAGDNGSPKNISEYTNDDKIVVGGKSATTKAGTHVPLLFYWQGTIQAGTVNSDLIDFTDFLPTLANIAGVPVPADYGALDGVSFAARLKGEAGTPRSWIFCYYDDHPGISTPVRWVQDSIYKLYDTSALSSSRLFFNIKEDIKERHPLPDTSLIPQEVLKKQQLLDVMNGYIAQGFPLLAKPFVTSVTNSTAVLKDSIQINGGSTITASGIVWSTEHDPTLSSGNLIPGNACIGSYNSFISGLASNTTYYVKGYATNVAGTAYSSEFSFTTLLNAPIAKAATNNNSSFFTANWNVLPAAEVYKLDVSASPTFTALTPFTLTEGFDNGISPPQGWGFSKDLIAYTSKFGTASPSIQFKSSKKNITTKILDAPATQLGFWMKALTANAGSLLVEGFNGTNWISIENITVLSVKPIIKLYTASSSPALADNFFQFRFTYTKTAGGVILDDVSVNYNDSVPSFVSGYNNLSVNDTSVIITGLTTNTTYYYRVRASNGINASGNSNIIANTTCSPPAITNITTTNLNCSNVNTGAAQIDITGNNLSYNWTGINNFTSSYKDIDHLATGTYQLEVASNGGCAVDTSVLITQPVALSFTTSADAIICAGGTTLLTVNGTGGTGDYHYTLSNGNITTGPQNDNHFTVPAGKYTIIITDDNGCVKTRNLKISGGTTECTRGSFLKSTGNKSEASSSTLNAEIFPNPSSGEFAIKIHGISNEESKIEITDIYGKKVYATSTHSNKQSIEKQLSAGVYFVKVFQGKHIKTLKLIKVNK